MVMNRVADAIFNRLKTETSCVYMVSGGGAMHLVDALGRSGIFYIAAIHEAGAGFMAIGHAMASNGLGVCLVTSGPGSTNVLTAVAAAWMDSIPLLVISGQAKSTSLVGDSGRRTVGVQEVDIIPMVEPITKLAYQAREPIIAMNMLENMLVLCKEGRPGPCFLSVPLDVQSMAVPE
jgi:acetolactate synthase-1/2/3 large subunit